MDCRYKSSGNALVLVAQVAATNPASLMLLSSGMCGIRDCVCLQFCWYHDRLWLPQVRLWPALLQTLACLSSFFHRTPVLQLCILGLIAALRCLAGSGALGAASLSAPISGQLEVCVHCLVVRRAQCLTRAGRVVRIVLCARVHPASVRGSRAGVLAAVWLLCCSTIPCSCRLRPPGPHEPAVLSLDRRALLFSCILQQSVKSLALLNLFLEGIPQVRATLLACLRCVRLPYCVAA